MGLIYINGVEQTTPFKVSFGAPLDTRLSVENSYDLINPDTWMFTPAYTGMIVFTYFDGYYTNGNPIIDPKVWRLDNAANKDKFYLQDGVGWRELAYADLAGTRYRLRGLYNNQDFSIKHVDETTEHVNSQINIRAGNGIRFEMFQDGFIISATSTLNPENLSFTVQQGQPNSAFVYLVNGETPLDSFEIIGQNVQVTASGKTITLSPSGSGECAELLIEDNQELLDYTSSIGNIHDCGNVAGNAIDEPIINPYKGLFKISTICGETIHKGFNLIAGANVSITRISEMSLCDEFGNAVDLTQFGDGLVIHSTGGGDSNYVLPTAQSVVDNIPTGCISSNPSAYPLGGVRIGCGLNVDELGVVTLGDMMYQGENISSTNTLIYTKFATNTQWDEKTYVNIEGINGITVNTESLPDGGLKLVLGYSGESGGGPLIDIYYKYWWSFQKVTNGVDLMLNEKKYENGQQVEQTPLIQIISLRGSDNIDVTSQAGNIIISGLVGQGDFKNTHYEYKFAYYNLEGQGADLILQKFKYVDGAYTNEYSTVQTISFRGSDTINVSTEDGRIIIDGIGGNQLPIATSEVLGCIKVGNGLSITEDGILSAIGGGGATYTAGPGINITNSVIKHDRSTIEGNNSTDFSFSGNNAGNQYEFKYGLHKVTFDNEGHIKDIGGSAPMYYAETITINVGDWVANEFVKTGIANVTADNIIDVAYHPDNYIKCAECVVYCSAQANEQLTFKCKIQPDVQVKLNIKIWKS